MAISKEEVKKDIDKFIFDLSERLGQFIVYLMRSITKD